MNPYENQDELDDILRKTDVRFMSLSCIVLTLCYLTEFQAMLEATVPLFVI